MTHNDSRHMKLGTFAWQPAIPLGGFLYCFGMFFAPEFELWGEPFFLWPIRVGVLLVVGGLATWVVLAATGRLRKASPAPRWGVAADDTHDGQCRHFGAGDIGTAGALPAPGAVALAGPMVNIDGTQMMDGGMFDVMGKSYGDSGHSFSSDISGGMSIAGIGSSSISGSDW